MNPAAAERSMPLRTDAAPPVVIAIVVSFNSAPHLVSCLSSLEGQRGVHPAVRVIDNASSDGSAELVRRRFPHVHVQENTGNLGFARANNQVLEREAADFYALVNPDTVLAPDALAACMDYMSRDARAGLVATRLVFPDGTLQPSCHSFLGFRNLLGETFGVHRILPGLRSLSSLYMPWFRHDRIAEVDWIQGAFLVARGEMVRAVGGFDPAFFMYGEEMDWCRRMRRVGWSVVFLPDPPVVHAGGASSGPAAGPMFVENLKGRVRFLRKHRGLLAATAARALIAVSVLVRFPRHEAKATLRSLGGRSPGESSRMKRTVFRSALRWVLTGLPLSPPPAAGSGP
jgi:GT2 family glycosyltransferase